MRTKTEIVLLLGCVFSAYGANLQRSYETRINTFEDNQVTAECDCGPDSTCRFKDDEKICGCPEGKQQKGGKCAECNCGPHSTCKFDDGEKICGCPPGQQQKGGKCVDCDCGPNSLCRFKQGDKICDCPAGQQQKGGKCVDCDCGPNSLCRFEEGDKICDCPAGQQQKGGKCVACDCGHDSNCKFEEGEKVCTCQEGRKQKRGKCEECNCGPNSTCNFEHGEKICSCQPGKRQRGEKCVETCNTDADCSHGGQCIGLQADKKFCTCKKGLEGDKCEVIEGCKYMELCSDTGGSCEYDPVNEAAYCNCKEDRKYNSKSLKCEDCDCGPKSTCGFEDGEKICVCPTGKQQKDGKCVESCNTDEDCNHGGLCIEVHREKWFCSCKKDLEGDKCEIISGCKDMELCIQTGGNCDYHQLNEEAYCQCQKGQQYNSDSQKCEECDCGENGICSFDENGKTCNCSSGYSQKIGTCEICNCGENGGCHFEGNYKVCTCNSGYSTKDGICEECNCGENGVCSFNGEKKTCECSTGYSPKDGFCEECDCGRNGVCIFEDANKKCFCGIGYSEKDGLCKEEVSKSIIIALGVLYAIVVVFMSLSFYVVCKIKRLKTHRVM